MLLATMLHQPRKAPVNFFPMHLGHAGFLSQKEKANALVAATDMSGCRHSCAVIIANGGVSLKEAFYLEST